MLRLVKTKKFFASLKLGFEQSRLRLGLHLQKRKYLLVWVDKLLLLFCQHSVRRTRTT